MILNAEKVEKALTLLGIPVDRIETTSYGDEVYAHCPGHYGMLGREDRSASWSVNADSGMHNCFSCGFGGNLATLVADRRNLSTPWGLPDLVAARRWLETAVGLDVTGLAERLEEIRDAYLSAPPPLEISEARLAVFEPPPDWALQARGLTSDACRTYSILWNSREEQWITPVRNPESGKLVGWQVKGQTTRMFKNFPTNMRKSRTVFGWDCYPGGTAVVVESPLDAARITATGAAHGLSTMGAKISDVQFKILRNVDRLVFAMDNPRIDAAGRQASDKILEAARAGLFECWFFKYPPREVKDPGDMLDVEIIHGVESARHCLYGRKAFDLR